MSTITDLEAQLAAAQAAQQAHGAQFEPAMARWQELEAQKRTSSGAVLAAILVEQNQIVDRYNEATRVNERLLLTVHNLKIELNRARQTLRVARENLATIANPPLGGLGEHVTSDQVRRVEREAKDAIRSLTGEKA